MVGEGIRGEEEGEAAEGDQKETEGGSVPLPLFCVHVSMLMVSHSSHPLPLPPSPSHSVPLSLLRVEVSMLLVTCIFHSDIHVLFMHIK